MKLLSHISIFLIISLMSLNLFSYEIKNGVLRTPDERFQNLKDYPYQPNYMMIDGLRIHYLDEGPKNADPIFLLHGEPAWSYLFRKMIPILTAQGHRVIVPDCVGFGKSDKFISKFDYSYKHHVDVMKELPMTLLLRPFNFETLATYVYQFAKDEMLEEAALPALGIVVVGIIPVILMNAALDRFRTS